MFKETSRGYSDWEWLRNRLVFVYDDKVPAYGNGRRAISTKYSAWLIRKGHLDISPSGSLTQRVNEGFWVIPPLCERDQFFSSNSKILSICFELEWHDGNPLFPLTRVISFKASKYPEMEKSALELIRVSGNYLLNSPALRRRNTPEFGKVCGIHEKYWKWLGVFADTIGKHGAKSAAPAVFDQRVINILRFLDTITFSGRIPYEYIQQKVSLSRIHIDRLFLEQTGMSLKKYLVKRMIEESNELLRTSLFSVKEIAYKLGFKTSSHFCAWFRKKNGIYPLEYRQRPE